MICAVAEDLEKKIIKYMKLHYEAKVLGKLATTSGIFPKIRGHFSTHGNTMYVEYCVDTEQLDVYPHLGTFKI
jgi:hypothetical protein